MKRPPKVLCAMITPWKDGEPNVEEVKRIVNFQIEKGLLGIFPVSSVGESAVMSFEQKCGLIKAVCSAAAGRVPVWSGIPANSVGESIKLAKFAEEAGSTGLVLMPPAFYPNDQESVANFIKMVAAATALPICLYNIPFFTAPLTAETVCELAKIDNIVGIKDSSGCAVTFMKMLSLCKAVDPEFKVMTGREEFLFASLCAGGDGCMTATSGVLPEVMTTINRLFEEGDLEGSKLLQMEAMEVMIAMASVPFPFGYKLAMEARGFDMGQSPLIHAELPLDSAQAKVSSLAQLINALMKQVN